MQTKSKVASGRRSSSGYRRVLAVLCASWFVFGFASPTGIQGTKSAKAIGPTQERWAANVERTDDGSHLQEFRLPTPPFLTEGGNFGHARGGKNVSLRNKREVIPTFQRVVEEAKRPRLTRVDSQKVLETSIDQKRLPSRLFSPETDVSSLLRGFETQPDPGMLKNRSAFHSPADDRLVGVPTILADLVNNDGADILATAYAPTDEFHASTNPFDALLGSGGNGGRFVPPTAEGDHEWMKQPLPPSVFSSTEQKCLATAIYFEARGEEVRGQAAVAQVILNRVRNPAYPASICDVVYQNDSWINKCQFSFACDGTPDVIADRRAYRLAKNVAMAVTGGKIFLPKVASSTHYNATYVNPSWARSMERMTQIGSHIFYRTFGGGWS